MLLIVICTWNRREKKLPEEKKKLFKTELANFGDSLAESVSKKDG